MKKHKKHDTFKSQMQEVIERERKELRKLRVGMSKLSKVMGDISPKNISTWPGFAERVLGAVVDGQGLHSSVFNYMEMNRRKLISEDIPLPITYLGLDRDDVVFDEDETRAARIVTDGGQEFFVVHFNENVEWDIYAEEGVDMEEIYGFLSRRLWAGRHAVRLDLKPTDNYNTEMIMTPMSLGEHKYIGKVSEHIQQWQQFKRAGLRRNILLQGRPGCGKSTLCLHAARELSARTVVITAKMFEECSLSEWNVMLKILRPEMLILDDVDRVGPRVLGVKLETIEDRNCDIPLVMFTSNDINQIPEAFRRPGRIDQILVVDEPSKKARRRMIKQFAAKYDVQIPKAQRKELMEMLLTHSGAHAVERIKRGKVLGWDYDTGPEDVTFKMKKAKES